MMAAKRQKEQNMPTFVSIFVSIFLPSTAITIGMKKLDSVFFAIDIKCRV